MGTLLTRQPDRSESSKPTHSPTIMMYATLIAALSFAAYASATVHLTEHEIKAWFHLVDTNDDHTVTAAELDTANRVFDAKCNLPDQIEAEDFFKAGDRNKDGFLTEAELDDDFHSYGELVQGETHSYFEILDTNRDGLVSLDEMRIGVTTGQDQCVVLRMISAATFAEKDCFDGEVSGVANFSECLHKLENEVNRRRR